MDPDPDGRREAIRLAVFGQVALQVDGGVEGLVGTAKGEKEAVAGGLDLLALVLGHNRPDRMVVPANKASPGLVTDQLGKAR